MKKPKDISLETLRKKYVIPALRRVSRWWPPSLVAVKKAERKKGLYECAKCLELFKRKEVHRDHIEPVVDPSTGFSTWDNHINRLLAPSESYQMLCIKCHKEKSREENSRRKRK